MQAVPARETSDPVYFAVVQNDPIHYSYAAYKILAVIATDYSDYQRVYDTYVAPRSYIGQPVTILTFRREPPNPLRDMVAQDAASAPLGASEAVTA